jgi:uncharacterized protein YoxC
LIPALPPTAFGVLAQLQRDTVFVVQQRPGWQLWIEALAAVATIVVALALLALGVGALVAAARVKRLIRTVEAHAQKVRVDLAPAVRNVTAATENLHFLSKRVRADAEELSATVNDANLRLRRAAEAAEERVGEFNALIGVVQEEAESLFIGGASTLRGIRAGTDAFRRFQDERAREAGWDEDEEGWDDEGEWDQEEEDGDEDEDGETEVRVERREPHDIDPDRVF